MKVDHIGIAVRDLEDAITTYEQLLNVPCHHREEVEEENVQTAFFKTGNTRIELLCASAPGSVIDKFIGKRGEGVHHVAFDVEDICQELERLKRAGFTILNETPRRGAGNRLIAFVHPADNHGVLIELCQAI